MQKVCGVLHASKIMELIIPIKTRERKCGGIPLCHPFKLNEPFCVSPHGHHITMYMYDMRSYLTNWAGIVVFQRIVSKIDLIQIIYYYVICFKLKTGRIPSGTYTKYKNATSFTIQRQIQN